ncbi:Lrp/AsnC family transcriptional regulator [Nonlabens antarcticus]|uniref:Lrp/AsnC family transcriptional regulator n=1 Tax=Nonlabens antarcticus TaxID=392714 RepID=UPI0018912A8D|nr:Lrp/AsnC family transcriptional regulator [Nonlabens antarcticus]
MKLDHTDLKLINLLQNDAKQTNKKLSLNLNLSVTAVYERIKKLERNGIIKQYVALVDKKKVGLGFQVFCHIKLAQHTQKHIQLFENQISKLDEVVECFHVSGEYDYLLKVIVRNMEHFREFMTAKLTSIEHVGSTQSSFTITEVKNNTQVPV